MCEKELWIKVLLQAIDDAQGKVTRCQHGPSQKRITVEARAWFKRDEAGSCTFLWVCSALELDPDSVRDVVFGAKAAPKKSTDYFSCMLRDYRKKHGISQRELARICGVCPATVSTTEAGAFIANPNRSTSARDKLMAFVRDLRRDDAGGPLAAEGSEHNELCHAGH